jgi:hypothetical protein
VLQAPRPAAAKVLRTVFTDAADTLAWTRTAYPVKGLTRLERTFVHTRAPRPR